MAVTKLDVRYYQAVGAYSSSEHTYTPANGATVHIQRVGGNCVYNQSVKMELVFGSDVLFVTHGDDNQVPNKDITGDGSTQLKIRLVNDSASTETIGGYYKAAEVS